MALSTVTRGTILLGLWLVSDHGPVAVEFVTADGAAAGDAIPGDTGSARVGGCL